MAVLASAYIIAFFVFVGVDSDWHRLVHFVLDLLPCRRFHLVQIDSVVCAFARSLRHSLTLHSVTFVINIRLTVSGKSLTHVFIALILFVD